MSAPARAEDVVELLAMVALAVLVGCWLTHVGAWVRALATGCTLDGFTLPGTHRVAQLMLIAAVSSGCVGGSAEDPVMVLIDSTPTSTAAPTTTAPTTTAAPPTTAPTTTAQTTAAAPPTTAPPATASPTTDESAGVPDEAAPSADTPPTGDSTAIAEHRLIVASGDNLWALAEATLVAHGASPTCAEVAAYWRAVLAANHVRSGNPDVIVPGELITMPAFSS